MEDHKRKRKPDSNIEEETEGYFDLDTSPLINLVSKSLRKKFPKLDKIVLDKTLTKTFKLAQTNLIEEYCPAVPKDQGVKLKPLLKELRTNIIEKSPTLDKILQSGLSRLEKERAIQMYDVLNNTEPYTLEYMNLNTRLSEMINVPCNNRKSKSNDRTCEPSTGFTYGLPLSNIMIESNLNVLKSKMNAQIPTMEKIASAHLINADKMRAYQLYETLQQTGYNTDEWYQIQRQINCILDSQMSSSQEVVLFEAEMDRLQVKEKSLKQKIIELDADQKTKSKIYEMYCDMISRSSSDSKSSDVRDKILWAVKLPYQKTIMIQEMNVSKVFHLLNQEVYGMQNAKERVVQAMNDRRCNPNSRSILALSGDPGVGKTKMAFSIAKVSGLPFDKISLGGTIDSTIFKGSDSVWRGATPSMILQILARVKYSNAVILLDEIDKLSSSPKGLEVQHALLHILDPVQNKEFQDAYLNEFNHDISRIWFILAMNDDSKLDSALRDRLNIIKIPSYTSEEMIQIIHKHVLPAALQDKGIEMDQIRITNDACKTLVTRLEPKGIRPIEKAISDIVSKLNLLQLCNSISLTFSVKDFTTFPYVITSKTIEALVPFPDVVNRDMYI
jgi:ATP-dependent Lon protease